MKTKKQWDIGEWYEPLISVKGWNACPKCKEFPRTWVFDNGSFAKCRCFQMYDVGVQSESISDVARRCGGSVREYNPDGLRIAWNEHIIKLNG